ncbi:AbrB/MazE/SpoVT family DNA-binding domain-containing protein [Sansalvadorimonas verongulae]|uniref:AbrB/MazE/SpoVT family DNA-binding domain-containing protein n=1 Tax=Sansalvadorimonas verongulae TaxID=2172824 RepID=UPI0012BD4C63|nr:transcriptional regulator [Sansalvadorimonas verongulae]MTI14086.1 transcriptional regulator [Sansalvadorimonas verongulae]
MKVQSEIKKWGNSLALRISGAMAELPQFEAGSKVSVDITPDGLLVKKVAKPRRKLKLPYSEKSLLEDMTPEKAHADELAPLNPSEFGA